MSCNPFRIFAPLSNLFLIDLTSAYKRLLEQLEWLSFSLVEGGFFGLISFIAFVNCLHIPSYPKIGSFGCLSCHAEVIANLATEKLPSFSLQAPLTN